MCRFILITLITLLPTATGALGLIDGTAGNRLRGDVVASIASPWAMTFVSPQRLLVTAKTGQFGWSLPMARKKSRRSACSHGRRAGRYG